MRRVAPQQQSAWFACRRSQGHRWPVKTSGGTCPGLVPACPLLGLSGLCWAGRESCNVLPNLKQQQAAVHGGLQLSSQQRGISAPSSPRIMAQSWLNPQGSPRESANPRRWAGFPLEVSQNMGSMLGGARQKRQWPRSSGGHRGLKGCVAQPSREMNAWGLLPICAVPAKGSHPC